MKYIYDKLWFRLRDLVEAGIPERSLHDNKEELETLEDNGLYVAYDSLRPSWKSCLSAFLGTEPMRAYRYLQMEKGMFLKDEDRQTLLRYKLPDGTNLSEANIQVYEQACAFLAWVTEGKNNLAYLGLNRLSVFWLLAREFVSFKGLALPSSRRLEAKWLDYVRFGAEAVLTKRFGTRNAAKMETLHVQLVIELMSDGRKFSKREVARQFRAIAEERGWLELSSISEATIYRYIDANRGDWELSRHGEKFHTLNRELIINQRRVSQPNLQWQADGTPAALWYKNESGQISKLYVLVIMDSHSMAIVGHAIGETENTVLVAEALKMALKTQGKRPLELRTDKGSAFSSGETKSLLASLGIQWKPTARGRARAKTVEVMQNWWQKKITGYYLNKSGMNLTVKTEDSKQNPDFFKAQSLPNELELAAQIRESLAIWNNTRGQDGRSPAERLADPAPQAKSFDATNLLEQFGLWRKRGKKLTRYQFKAEGLELQVGGQVFRYLPSADSMESQAALFQRLMFTQFFYVKYDPTDLEQIGLYILPQGQTETEVNLRFWGYAELKQLSAQLLTEATDAEKVAFHHQRAIQKAQKRWILEQTEQRQKVLQEARCVLGGAIEHQRVHKDAANRAKLELQRLEALGYQGLGAEEERQELAAKQTVQPIKSLNIYQGRYRD